MRRRDERGASLAIVATLVVVLVLIAAFAVDLGMQRVVRRDMQAMADIIALDLARLVDGRTAESIRAGSSSKPPLDDVKAASFERNNDSLVGEAPEGCANGGCVRIYLVQADDAGGYPTASGLPVEVAPTDKPNAVVVVASSDVSFAFSGMVGVGGGQSTRRALAMSQSNACFRLGSFAAAVRSGHSALLNAMIGDALKFTAIGYAGLADASISLGGLGAELGALTPNGLMSTQVTVAQLAGAAANVLEREGGPTVAAQVDALRKLAASSSVKVLTIVSLGDLMELSTAGPDALATKMNVLDLIAGAAFLANGTNSVKTGVIWNLPAISNAEIQLVVSEVPQLACGEINKATASTGQLSYYTALEYSRGSKLAELTFMSDPILNIHVDIARATGLLTDVRCGDGTVDSPEGLTVHVSRDGPTLSFGVPIHLKGTVGIEKYTQDLAGLLGSLGYTLLQITNLLLNLNKLKIELDLEFDLGSAASSASAESDVTFLHPPMDYDTAVPVPGRSPSAIPQVTFTRAEIRGTAKLVVDGVVKGSIPLNDVDLGFLVDAVRSRMLDDTINPLIDKVNSVVTPLGDALGITLAGADLFALPRPSCDSPALRG